MVKFQEKHMMERVIDNMSNLVSMSSQRNPIGLLWHILLLLLEKIANLAFFANYFTDNSQKNSKLQK